MEFLIAQGITGVIAQNATSDFRYYENTPEGRLTAVMATCHQSTLFKVRQQHQQPFKLFVTGLSKVVTHSCGQML